MMVAAVGGRYLALQTAGAAEIWPRLVRLMERPELAADPRFATPTARREHWAALSDIVAAWLAARFPTRDEALETLTAARVPSAPVLSPREVIALPHLEARRFFADIPHPARGSVRITATPFHVDGDPPGPAGPAPYRIGEHTRAVLADLAKYSARRIDELVAQRVLVAP
jgi:crotonobetainyl-CoA:carnitine CoA-transferase CaiB-like acyl-CoA transferase